MGEKRKVHVKKSERLSSVPGSLIGFCKHHDNNGWQKVCLTESRQECGDKAVCGPGLLCMSASPQGPSSQNTNWTSKLSNYVPCTPGDGLGCQHRYREHKEKLSQMWNNIF